MAQEQVLPILTAVFVDYDNIYMSLKRRSEDAAKRFAKDAAVWIKEIETGRLLTPTNSPPIDRPRRIVLNRCYGNPVPRRNTSDNTTDMSSFPFVRHHFLRAGFEVVDCPPLTAQLKNSSDIRMVMDMRDFLIHDTRFEEFVILSGDADFTPVLHRLRAHNRRTVVYANDYTAAPYTAICDGEVRETSLLAVLTDIKTPQQPQVEKQAQAVVTVDTPAIERTRIEVLAAVTAAVRSAGGPVPLEALAERTTRALGHDRTVGTQWAGAGSFLELLRQGLPEDIRLTDQPPYLAYEAKRGLPQAQPVAAAQPVNTQPQPQLQAPAAAPIAAPEIRQRIEPTLPQPMPQAQPAAATAVPQRAARPAAPIAPPVASEPAIAPAAARPVRPAAVPPPAPAARQIDHTTAIQQSIARIHDACQAPPLSPPEYRALFEIMAKEINEGGLQGAQTLNNIHVRAQEVGIKLARDDVRFIMEVVSEADPWFEQGAVPSLFAGRFRNFVVARCRSQGLNLSSDELDLIEAWFAGTGQPVAPQNIRVPAGSSEIAAPQRQIAQQAGQAVGNGGVWGEPAGRGAGPSLSTTDPASEEFPKILRTRLRG